jgi:hypothetical protein
MSTRILKKSLCAAVLLFALVGAPNALAGPNVLQNPSFEYRGGSFAGWGWGGSFGAYTTTTPYNSHSGSYSAVIGYPYRPANLYSYITQQVWVPFGSPTLTFWIKEQCPPTPSFDNFIRLMIRDVSGTGLYTNPIFECTTTPGWVQRSVDMSRFAGHLVDLQFDVWTRGVGPFATYTLLDDVSLSSP